MDEKRHHRFKWLTLLCWSLFATGLLIQQFAPRLEISNGAFVMPPSLTTEGNTLRPAEIVAKERRMQLISAVLTLGGAIGIAYCHRHAFFRKASPK
jgi:hypothetical protein